MPVPQPSEAGEEPRLERTPIHEALVRRPLYFGVPKDYLVIEAGVLVLLVVVFWPGFEPGRPPALLAFVPALVVVLLFLLVHVRVLARLSRKDPKWLDILMRAQRFPEVLLRTPRLRSRRIPYWKSVPRR